MNVLVRLLKQHWILYVVITVCSLFLLLYSFTQADLNLPISTTPVVAFVESLIKATNIFGPQFTFQHIGYFERGLSTNLYISILAGLFGLYGWLLYMTRRNKLSAKHIILSITMLVTIIFLSYPAFSYDIYNYMFDARIVTKYHENPYVHKALDYPSDSWLSIMRWTHRTYPYGPVWLLLTIPFSYLGFQDFGVTLYLFKLIMSISYVGAVYFLYKILEKKDNQWALFGAVFFAFNPLVIIESLVSAHNDIVMIMLSLWAYYLLIEKKRFWSLLLLITSIGIKFATVFLIPLFFLELLPLKFKKISFEKKVLIGIGGMTIAIVAASIRTQFQPWYLLYIFPYAAIISKKNWIRMPILIFSLGGLCMYMPYLFRGDWNPPVPAILDQILWGTLFLSILSSVAIYFKKKLGA